jgi:hypothetical protein
MGGFVFAMSACVACRRPFSYNPNAVPSIRINGVREPVCRGCMDFANAERTKMGLEPHPIRADAYEAAPEGEVLG